MSGQLLLLSGGLDSTALAAWLRPRHALTIDYGHVAASGEIHAGRTVANQLGVSWSAVSVDCSQVGSGLLAGTPADPNAPVPEWWPYRNQMLVTIAAAWALPRGFDELILGSVASDSRHRDGTGTFYEQIDRLIAFQEGGMRVRAPAITMTSATLLQTASPPEGLLGFTHSCHRGPLACGLCPGCIKRSEVLHEVRRD